LAIPKFFNKAATKHKLMFDVANWLTTYTNLHLWWPGHRCFMTVLKGCSYWCLGSCKSFGEAASVLCY